MKFLTLSTAALILSTTAGLATEFDAAARSFLSQQIETWAQDPVLIDAVRAQNAQTANHSPAEIDRLDQSWRAEVGAASSPMIDPVLNNAAADFLRNQAEASNGAITEILLMDAVGLNVAVSHVTSDYWQGDEAKFTETYDVGPDAVHIGEIELDESSQSYQSQLSFTLTDPSSGEVLGAITVGVDAEGLM